MQLDAPSPQAEAEAFLRAGAEAVLLTRRCPGAPDPALFWHAWVEQMLAGRDVETATSLARQVWRKDHAEVVPSAIPRLYMNVSRPGGTRLLAHPAGTVPAHARV